MQTSQDSKAKNATDMMVSENDAVIRRVEIMCELFETAFEMKSLELRRKHPEATDAWIKDETLRLSERGCK